MNAVGKSGFALLLAATLFSAGALAQGEDEAKTEQAALAGQALKDACLKEADSLDIVDQGEIKEYMATCIAVKGEGGEVERAAEGG